MATFDEKQQQVLNEINTLIKTSPASAKIEAQNLAIEPVAPEVVPPVVDYLNSQKIPEVDLAGVLSLGAVNSKTAANVAELSEPIDKSIGVNIPEVGTATEKIATGRYQDIDKVRDINQFTYGLEDQMAAASSGSAENNAYVENLRAGNAGLNVATSSRLNPTDRQDGSEAFFGARYPLLQTTVSPFKVVIPEYNLEAKSQTLDPEKLAYQLATNIGGRPVPTYVGYTNSGIDLSEAWYSSLVKGVRNVPVNLADMFVKAGGLGAANVLQAQTRVESAIASYYAGDSDAEATSRLEKGLAVVNRATDLSAEDWAAFTKEYKKIFGSEHTEFATGTNYIVEQIPTVLGQVGMIYGANVLGAAQGLNPVITNALVGATFGASQGGDVFTNIQNVAISPTDRLKRANMAAGASTVLNSLGGWAMFGAKAAAARQFMKEYGKRYALAAGEGVVGMGTESLTEGADQVLFNYFSYNMGDDKRAERMNGYVMALVLGAVGGALSVPAKVFNESLQIHREQILSGEIDAGAPEFIKQLSVGVNALHDAGLYTREQALDMILATASPEGINSIKEKQKGAILGMLDRATPEVASYVRNLGAEESARFMNDLKVIDQTVYKNMPEGIDDQTKVMVSRAMQGIASVVTYYGGDFRMPKIEIRNTEPMAYEPDTNTLYINTETTGEAIDFPMVQDKRISLINPVQRGILHELGHLLDTQLGRGTNFENFMPTYFDAIAKVYGKEKAASVKSKMDASGARDAFARSTEPGDVKEKQRDKITETVNEKNTAEYFAYAIGRLGAKVGKVFGMGGGEVAQHIDAINAMAQMVKIPSIQEALSAYQTALETLVKNNSKTIIDMAKAQGEEGLARKIQDFVAGDNLALTKEEVLALYKVLKTYTNVDAAAIIDKAFDGTKIETFMERAEREYGDSIQKEGMTIGELQKRANQKADREVRRLQSKDNAVVSEEDLPNFEMNEQIAYASTRGPLEGNELDVDKHYAEGEALGTLGAAMRHGYGNNVLFDLGKDKKFYYDVWNYATLKHNQPESNIDTHRVMYALEDLAERFPSKINDTNTKAQLIEKFKKQYDSAIKSGETALKDFTNSILNFMSGYLEEVTGKKISDAQKEDFKKLFAHERVVDKLDKGAMEILEMNQDMYDEMLKSTIHMDNDRLTEYIVTAEMYQDAIKSLNALPESFSVERTKSGAELHSFETPDLEQMLNEDKPLEEQSKYVRDAIKQMAEENPHISLFGGKYELAEIQALVSDPDSPYWSDYIEDDDLANLTGETFRRALNEYFWHDEEGQKERVKFFESKVDQSNKRMLEGAIKTDAYRTTSLLLNKYGIKGIEFNGDRDGHGAVIFNGHTKHMERLYESVVDVSDLLGSQKKQFKSALVKRTDAKPDGANYEDDVKEVSKIMKDAGKAPRWFTRFFANGDITTGLWALGGKKLVEHFDLIGRMNRVSNAATSSLLDFDAKLKKGMGFKSNVERDKFENQASINSIDVDYAVDPLTDQIMGLKISPLVAMNLYNNAKSTVGRRKVLNTFGGNEQQMNKVLNSLTDEQKKEADLMMDFIKENWKYYKESFEQEGDEIDEEPYWPIADAEHIAFGDRRINSTFGRKDDANGMISLDVDAREVFNSYVQRTAGAKEHLYATIQRMKDLFGYQADLGIDNPTTEVRKLSKQMFENSKKIRGLGLMNLGDESKYNKFMDLIDDFLQKHESSLVGSESLNIVARNLTSGLLQWKPIQFMKNLANAAGYWGLVDSGSQMQYWKDTAWAATHPIDAAKYMFEKVPYIRNRLRGQNIDEALTQQTAGQDSLLMNWAKNTDKLSKDGQRIVSNLVALTQASRRLGYTPMLSGDVAANVIGGYGLLKQYEAKYGDKAGDKLSEDIVMHQASNNQATRSLLQRQWNRDLKGEFLRFGSEGVQKGKSIGLSFAQAARGERSYGSATKETLSTLSSMILFALISAGIIDLFDSNDDNDKQVYEALEREGISAVAGFSVIGNSIISPIMSMFLTGEMASIGTPLSNIVSADLRKITKGDYDDAILDGIASVIPVVGVDNLTNMGSGVYRSATAEDSQNFWAGLYQLMGRSENYAEKRTGLKK